MINEEVFMLCPHLRLIPYLRHHVLNYNEWMCDPVLLVKTESEPLTLQEEYENQLSWLQSMEKLTFILAAPLPRSHHKTDEPHHNYNGLNGAPTRTQEQLTPDDEDFRQLIVRRETPFRSGSGGEEGGRTFEPKEVGRWFPLISEDDYVSFGPTSADDTLTASHHLLAGQKPLPGRYVPSRIKNIFTGEPEKMSSVVGDGNLSVGGPYFVMIGDCNLFLLNEGGGGDATDSAALMDRRTFEVEAMIAYKPYRRRGLAARALRMLIQYAISVLGGTNFVAKILETNTDSIKLFQNKLGFTEFKRVQVFNEIHYMRSIYTDEEKRNWEEECVAAGCGDCWCGPYTEEVERAMVLLSRDPSFSILS